MTLPYEKNLLRLPEVVKQKLDSFHDDERLCYTSFDNGLTPQRIPSEFVRKEGATGGAGPCP